MGWKLTDSQLEAVVAFCKFLAGPEQVFMLKGAAGTGKTTLIVEFLRILKDQGRGVNLLAPTGRAAQIIGSKTGRQASTIHRGIYIMTDLKAMGTGVGEGGDGSLHAKFGLRSNNDSPNAVYIVDEASMVSDAFSEGEAFSFGSGRLLTDLFEYAKGRKIIFVGDYAQLPPIEMNFSPALDSEYLSRTFNCRVSEYTLREVIRQESESSILRNATKIRNNIEARTFIEFGIDDGPDATAENENLLTPYFALSESRPSVRSAIITYSNSQALQYNLAVRRRYFGERAPRVVRGDLLLIARNNYGYDEELFNGNIVMVESCGSDSEVETHSVSVRLGQGRVETVDLRFRRAVIRFGVNGNPVSLNVMLLDNFLDDPNGAVGGVLARAIIIDFERRLPPNLKARQAEIRRLMHSGSNLTPEQTALRDEYVRRLKSDPYYNAVICKYGYAMTCHKAQGGEWDNVFVDMARIGGVANEDYFRWAYTAITRASKHLWHYRSPDFNFIAGLVVEEIQRSRNLRVNAYQPDGDFCTTRFERIRAICEAQGINVDEDRSRDYQHWLSFYGRDGEMALFVLWYRNGGYSDRVVLRQSVGADFAALCQGIITETIAPASVPFTAPTRPFAERLVALVRTRLEELDIRLLNITQEQYQDVFHLQTDGLAKVAFCYTDQHNYTHMRLQSTLGAEDQKLALFRQSFL